MKQNFYALVSVLCALSVGSLPGEAFAAENPGLTRRNFLIAGGSVAVSIVAPDQALAQLNHLTAESAAELGVLDRAICNEGYASFISYLISKHRGGISSRLGEVFLPFWTSYVGFGAWLKVYSDFIARVPEAHRVSIETDRAFVAYARGVLTVHGSARGIFELAFPGLNTKGLNPLGLTRVIQEHLNRETLDSFLFRASADYLQSAGAHAMWLAEGPKSAPAHRENGVVQFVVGPSEISAEEFFGGADGPQMTPLPFASIHSVLAQFDLKNKTASASSSRDTDLAGEPASAPGNALPKAIALDPRSGKDDLNLRAHADCDGLLIPRVPKDLKDNE